MKYPKIKLNSIQRTGEIIDNAFKLMKHGIKPLFISYAVMIFPLSSVFYYFYLNFMSKISTEADTMNVESPQFWLNFLAVMLFIVLAFIFIFTVIQLIPVNYILLYEQTEDYTLITPLGIIKETFKKFLKMLWGNFMKNLFFMIVLLISLVILGIIIGIIVAISVVFFKSAFENNTPLMVIAILFIPLGIIAFYLFIFLLYAPLFMFPVVYLREKKGAISSILRCYELVKGEWWKTFGLVILVYLIISSVSMVFYIPSYSIMITAMMSGQTIDYASVSYIVSSLVASFVYFIFFIGSFAMSLKYYHLVEKNEGPGFEERLEALSAGTETV